MPDIGKISKWQCLFRHFEGAVWEKDEGSFKTNNLIGTTVVRPEISNPLAREISRLQDDIIAHWDLHAQRRAQRVDSPQVVQRAPLNEPSEDQIRSQISELLGEVDIDSIQGSVSNSPPDSGSVHPSQIQLIEINENSRVEAIVYPRSFLCPTCGHYEIIDSHGRIDLYCPCCSTKCPSCGSNVERNSRECPSCGRRINKSILRQFNYVFDCPRCAKFEELSPRLANPNNTVDRTFLCNTCNTGHFHLKRGESFTVSRWECSDSHCGHSERMDKHCNCHIPSTVSDDAIPSIMKPTPVSASITSPLIQSYLWLGSNNVSLDSLRANHNVSQSVDLHFWDLDNGVESVEKRMIEELYGIVDVFSVPEIRTTTVIYGYRSGITSFPIVINDQDRLAKLFVERTRSRYRAYLADTIGRALVIQFSKEKIVDGLINSGRIEGGRTYDAIANECINFVSTGDFQDILSGRGPTALIELLHAYEHALFKTVVNQVGLEVFGSKILIRDGAIILYEREEVGPGGLVQISNADQFIRALRGTQQILSDCPQLCEKGCLACLYINDYYCQPYIPDEIDRWLPPNSLMDRILPRSMIHY